MHQHTGFVCVLDEDVRQGFEDQGVNCFGVLGFEGDCQLGDDVPACLEPREKGLALVVLEEGSEGVPDWHFELLGPSEQLLEGVHFLEIQFPAVVSGLVFELSDYPA